LAKPRKSGSRTRRARRGGRPGTANRVGDIPPAIIQLLLEGQELTRPGHYDPQKAMRVRLALDGVLLHIQRAKAEERAKQAEFFDWLESNIPEMFRNTGRPHWIESDKVMGRDRELLKEFEETLARNVAANAGKKHRASQKTYSDLADKYGDSDEDTVKRRVMRARRRQKNLKESIQEIFQIIGPPNKDRSKILTSEEYEINRERLLKAFRRIEKTK
jgi:hypothetical protein